MSLSHAVRRCFFLLLLIPAVLAGCSVKSYRSDLPKNFHINTVIHKSSAFRNTGLAVDVHLVNARCETDLLGRIYVDDPKTDVGVPVDRPVYLDFIFVSKVALSGDLSVVRYQTVMTARSGHEYAADATYDKGIYTVVINEKRRGGPGSKKIARKSLQSCLRDKSGDNNE